jgi:hypothetical protein
MSLRQAFQKILSANDVGATEAHQAGIHIPKTNKALLDFLPPLDAGKRNPDAWIDCLDEENGVSHKFRYVYYNNRLHDKKGTRNEYRITHMTGYLRQVGANEGDILEISKLQPKTYYRLRVLRVDSPMVIKETAQSKPVKLVGWNRVH